MQIPIPDDWDGESYRCVEVQWPDSPAWIALLIGFLAQPSRGRFWDGETGTITDVQQIGFDIFDANVPLNSCSGEDGDSGETPTPGDAITAAIGVCYGMDCSIPFGVLRWNDGVLEYRYCGEWYAVDGVAAIPDWGDPGDEDIGDEPDAWVGSSPCSKTVAATGALFDIVDTMIDQAGDDVWPFDGLAAVRADYPGVNWDDVALLSAYLSALKLPIAGFDEEAKDAEARQDLRCRAVELIASGNQGMTNEEYTAVQSAIWNWGKAYFPFAQYGLFDVEIQNLYYKAWKAFGPGDMRKITTMVSATGDEDCSCPGAGYYTGGVYFLGTHASGPGGTGVVVEAVDVLDDGQALQVTLAGSNGDFRYLEDVRFYIAGTEGVDNLVIRQSPYQGVELPTEEWQTYAPVADPTLWTVGEILNVGVGESGAQSYAVGAGWRETRCVKDPEEADFGQIKFDMRWAPSTGGFGGTTKRYYLRLDIVEVNLTDYR